MKLLQKLFAAGRVLQAGEKLQNPGAWKSFQVLAPIMALLVGGVLQVLGIEVNEIQINSISDGLTDLGVIVFNTYFTVATTDKIGLPAKTKR
jgi:hypothetical protein